MQSRSSSKKPKTLLLPKGKNLLGAPCLCTPAEISPPWRRLGCWMGSAAVTLCSALVAHVGTRGGKPAGCLQCQPGSPWTPVEMRSSKLSVGGCTVVPQPGTAGSVLQPVSLPFPAALAGSHGVFAVLDGAHRADRQGTSSSVVLCRSRSLKELMLPLAEVAPPPALLLPVACGVC